MARAELANFAAGRMGVARGHSIDRREVSSLFTAAGDAPVQAAEFFSAFSRIHSFFGFDNPRLREILPLACPGKVFFHPFRPRIGGHIAAAYLEAVQKDGASSNAEPLATNLELQADDLAEGRRLAAQCGADAGRYILLMPGSGSLAKNWPAENYLQLAQELARSTAVLTVLGPAEDHLEKSFPNLQVISNSALGALAGLARLSSAFVGNDSGVSHLAAAAGARGVVIFGPTDPARWRPLGAVSVLRRMPLAELPWQEVAAAIEVVSKCAEWHA
jgi:ADP-heptose:LPS heptosyltransferase